MVQIVSMGEIPETFPQRSSEWIPKPKPSPSHGTVTVRLMESWRSGVWVSVRWSAMQLELSMVLPQSQIFFSDWLQGDRFTILL